jgi:uncharacterized membrane protein
MTFSGLSKKCYMANILILVIGLSIIICGCLLLWFSINNTCSAWSFTNDYQNQKCYFREEKMATLTNCNVTTPCICLNTNLKVSCLGMPPNYLSVWYIMAGFFLICLGIICIIVSFVICYLK